jgi:hypothetical protein
MSESARPPAFSPADRATARNALIAGFLGWTLDAFDYFILTYVLAQVGVEFHKSVAEMTLAITASLMMRPLGALLFGLMADLWGRRLPLMLDVLFYSLVEVLSGFAPSYGVFLALRLLYGIGMGGEWGVGASLAMEAVPAKWRGVLSGVLQEGYALGNLLAAVAFWTVFPHWGWRRMFFIGGLPALLTLFIRARVKESDAWKAQAAERRSWSEYFRSVAGNWKRFLYLVALMAMMNFMSHQRGGQRGCHHRRNSRGPVLRSLRPAPRDGELRAVGAAADSRLDFFTARGGAGELRSIPDAVHGAGRLGRDSGAHQRALARPLARIFPRIRLPGGRADRFERAADRSAHGRTLYVCPVHGPVRRGGVWPGGLGHRPGAGGPSSLLQPGEGVRAEGGARRRAHRFFAARSALCRMCGSAD